MPCLKYACYFPDLESLLRCCIANFLNTFSVSPDPDGDIGEFRHLFSRVLSAYPDDPPLEAVWFFSALKFYDARDDVLYILHFISAFTASSPAAAKPLALLAPLVSGLFHSDKPRGKVEGLVDAVLRYISRICSSRPRHAGSSETLLPVLFPELVKAWFPHGSSRPFEVLFPLAGDEARRELIKGGCTVTFLAGVVVAEAFLFRLYLKVQGAAGVPRSELHKGLITWAITSIQGFKNQEFFGVLLNMLAKPPLPVYSPLSTDDEILVRDVLYYALILSDAEVDQADSSLFPIFVSRLVITFDAISDARAKGDHESAKSYISAFSTSNIPSYLTNWVISRAGTKQLVKPTATTPQAFVKWLVVLEDKEFEVFGDKSSRIKKMLVHDEGQNDNHNRISQSDDGCYDDMDTEGGEDETVEMETANNAPMAAAHSVKVMANVTRKRKDCETEDTRVVKIVKYKAKDSSVKDYFQATNGMSNGREVENVQSDDKMEETV